MAEDQNPDDDAVESEDAATEPEDSAAESEDAAPDDLSDLEFDGDEPDATADAGPTAAAKSDLPLGEMDPDEIDSLIDADPEPEPADSPSDGSAATLAALAGDGLGRITEFTTRLTEVLHVGLDSVTGQKATLSGSHLEAGTYNGVAEGFADIPHVALRLKLAFSEEESHLLVALMPLADAGSLVRLETDADELADPDFRDRQLDAIATAVRELLDLMSLALFTDALMGAEVTLNEIRLDSAAEILAVVAAEVGDEAAVRLDVSFDVADSESVGLTVGMAPGLITRFGQALASSTTRPAAGVGGFGQLPAMGAVPPPSVGAVSEQAPGARTFDAGNVSPIRPDSSAPRVADDVDVHPVRFPTIGETPPNTRPPRSLELLMDVEMRVSVELGRSSMSVEEILSLGPGSVVELNKLAGEPVDILVNDHLIARGEVVVVDENFGVRVTEIVSAHKRAHAMAR